jgi:hypothetical protein
MFCGLGAERAAIIVNVLKWIREGLNGGINISSSVNDSR